MLKLMSWSSLPTSRSYFWRYHRLANAGRLQIGRLILIWPLPWAKVCHGQPGYGHGETRWRGILAALGWKR